MSSTSSGFSAGAGKGRGTSESSSNAARTLAQLSQMFAEETTDLRQGLIDVMQEVLTSGGSSVPIISEAINRSTEAGKSAAAQTNKETETSLEQSGLAGTPFAASTLAQVRQAGNFDTKQIASQIQTALAQAIFNMIPNFVMGQGQTALSGLANAIPGLTKVRESQTASGKGINVGV
jgi:hypothetical protein